MASKAKFNLKNTRFIKYLKKSRLAFCLVYWIFVGIILLAIQPIKIHAWNEIEELGNLALQNRQFDLSILQYEKLRLINPFNTEPKQLISRAQAGQQDILTLRNFYSERKDYRVIELINEATTTYSTPEAAIAVCQNLLKEKEPQLSLVCIKNTTKKWPDNRDAWVTEEIVAGQAGQQDLVQTSRQKITQIDPTLELKAIAK